MNKNKKGFTLIELLVTIGILAVLATVVVLVLNPAELFRQARDSQRLSDLGVTRDAINLYLTLDETPTIAAAGPFSTNNATCSFTTCTVRNLYSVDSTGWVAIDLTDGGNLDPAISTLPQDPTNVAPLQYSFKANTTALTYELNAQLESTKYASQMTGDGGNSATFYEVGNDPGLNL